VLWVIYGVVQALVMLLERRLEALRGGRSFVTTRARRALAWFLTFHFIVFSCLLIRARDLHQVGALLASFGAASGVDPWAWVALAGALLTHFLPQRVVDRCADRVRALPTVVLGLCLGLLAGVLIWVMVGQTSFIYFQF
jgi:hypothetical protein